MGGKLIVEDERVAETHHLESHGGAVEVDALLHGLRPELDRPLDVEELAPVRE